MTEEEKRVFLHPEPRALTEVERKMWEKIKSHPFVRSSNLIQLRQLEIQLCSIPHGFERLLHELMQKR